jgi:hypothetical protein
MDSCESAGNSPSRRPKFGPVMTRQRHPVNRNSYGRICRLRIAIELAWQTKNRQLILNFPALLFCPKREMPTRGKYNFFNTLLALSCHFPLLDSLFLLCYFCKNFYVFSRLCSKSQFYAGTAALMNCYVATSAEEILNEEKAVACG